jgi:anion-transporting  ArsA/GET3 family ATPase
MNPFSRIILVGGPGGVGKTTCAAALGVKLAESGKKTLVLTVDPAKRLAQALGLSDFNSDFQTVRLPSGQSLDVTMLDTERYFDKVIAKFAASSVQRDKILANPLYQTMVENLGGTHEYAAMERLYEVSQNPTYEHIVVDTPPMANAVELLKAPDRLASFMDNSILRWFQNSPSLSKKLFASTSKLALKLMSSVFGSDFLKSFETLMTDFEGMQYGFQERHRAVSQLLKSEVTSFLLVTYPSEERLRETTVLVSELERQHIRLKAIFLNRVEPNLPNHFSVDPANLPPNARAWLKFHSELCQSQRRWTQSFGKLSPEATLRVIERTTQDIHSLESLSRFGDLLIS